MTWTDKLWSLWVGRKSLFRQVGQRYEYFILAAVCWCCYDDDAARVAAITTAATTTPDGRAFMIKYLEIVGALLDDDYRKMRVAELITTIETTVGQESLSMANKLIYTRALRSADREYHRAWKSMWADPDVFCNRYPQIRTLRCGWPEWLHDAMYGCARVCPNCRRTNTASADHCACGHTLADRDCPNFG